MRGTTSDRLKHYLRDIDFPADKQAVLDEARRTGADEDTIAALRSIPPEEYTNFSEVRAATPMDSLEHEGQTDADKAQQRRHHAHSGLSEHHREATSNPIVDELGENRGS